MTSRRHTLLLVLWLACSACWAQAPAASPKIEFLSAKQAADVLAGPGAQTYFDAMQGPELVAKTQLDLLKLPLSAARDAARQHYAREAQAFTLAEQEVLVWAVNSLYPTLVAKAPLYARSVWKFAKVSDLVEGGLPHTRGDAIVFSAELMQGLAASYQAKDYRGLSGFLNYLLLHEQSHVLQRAMPAVFDDLVVQVLGFERMPAPQLPWLAQRGVVNPDAPVSEWAYPLPQAPGQAVLPYLLLSNLSKPRMPDDFQMVAVMLGKEQGAWQVQEKNGQPVTQPLLNVKTYVAAFPNQDEIYHPYEISADLLGYWLSGRTDGDARHPLRAKLVAWAAKALQ